ncbi:MAG: SRPBCC family protein [Planctomycetes bacterium]|nr:SRPBCC family protein [Planctomycetota bacterium]
MADDKKKKKSGGIGSVIKLLLVLIVVAVVAFVGYGFTLPSAYHFERSVVIEGDADDVHEWVGDLKKWDEWGPWRDEDPSMKYTYGESTTQQGDKMSWTGKDGSGSLTFTKVDPEKGIEYSFQWEDWTPNPGAVTYEEMDGGKVKVTWSMNADTGSNIFTKYMMSFGGDMMNEMFDKGLNKLKTKVEAK